VWAQYSISSGTAPSGAHHGETHETGIPRRSTTETSTTRPPAGLGYQEDLPVSEFTRRIFSLPMHPYLAAGDQRRIAALFQ
jgi:dTDP-4-amino-4,6-dideoxygalactose transaminase